MNKAGSYQLGLSTSFGEKHCNNTKEAIKHLEEIIIPYDNEKGQSLGNRIQFVLLIWGELVVRKGNKNFSIRSEQYIVQIYSNLLFQS